MNTRIQFSRDGDGLPCENCGYSTLRVARIISEDGTVIGRTLACTACGRNRHRRDAAPPTRGMADSLPAPIARHAPVDDTVGSRVVGGSRA